MKAERKNKAFEPVTITLESQDELNYLWHALNIGYTHVQRNTSDKHHVNNWDCKHDMWDAIDEIMNE